jgi:hypothetical protein
MKLLCRYENLRTKIDLFLRIHDMWHWKIKINAFFFDLLIQMWNSKNFYSVYVNKTKLRKCKFISRLFSILITQTSLITNEILSEETTRFWYLFSLTWNSLQKKSILISIQKRNHCVARIKSNFSRLLFVIDRYCVCRLQNELVKDNFMMLSR